MIDRPLFSLPENALLTPNVTGSPGNSLSSRRSRERGRRRERGRARACGALLTLLQAFSRERKREEGKSEKKLDATLQLRSLCRLIARKKKKKSIKFLLSRAVQNARFHLFPSPPFPLLLLHFPSSAHRRGGRRTTSSRKGGSERNVHRPLFFDKTGVETRALLPLFLLSFFNQKPWPRPPPLSSNSSPRSPRR